MLGKALSLNLSVRESLKLTLDVRESPNLTLGLSPGNTAPKQKDVTWPRTIMRIRYR